MVGGLAARAYGAQRPLVDIDVYAPTTRLSEIAATARERVVRKPARHQDEQWDLTFMAFEYSGMRIELGGADDARLFDRKHGI